MFKDKLKVGQRVKFRRSHDKSLELTGKITRIHDAADDVVDIETEADGRIVEVSGIETAHAADVTPLEEPGEEEEEPHEPADIRGHRKGRRIT